MTSGPVLHRERGEPPRLDLGSLSEIQQRAQEGATRSFFLQILVINDQHLEHYN